MRKLLTGVSTKVMARGSGFHVLMQGQGEVEYEDFEDFACGDRAGRIGGSSGAV